MTETIILKPTKYLQTNSRDEKQMFTDCFDVVDSDHDTLLSSSVIIYTT